MRTVNMSVVATIAFHLERSSISELAPTTQPISRFSDVRIVMVFALILSCIHLRGRVGIVFFPRLMRSTVLS